MMLFLSSNKFIITRNIHYTNRYFSSITPPTISTSPPLVLFCGNEFQSASTNVSRSLLGSICRVEIATRNDLSRLPEATVAVPFMTRIDANAISKAAANGKLKLIQQWGSGLEGIDIEAATKHGILVSNVPATDHTARSTAEMAIHLIMACSRQTNRMKPTIWGGPRGKDIGDMRIGIVGSQGKIGRALGSILVGGYQPRTVIGLDDKTVPLAEQITRLGFPLDCLVLTIPLNSNTLHIINTDVLNAFTKRAIYDDNDNINQPILINVGRGQLVHRPALEHALTTNQLGAFGTDVWWEEPPMENDPLLSHPKICWTSHAGGMGTLAGSHNDEVCATEILNFIEQNQIPKFTVNDHNNKIQALTTTTTTPTTTNNHEHIIEPPILPRPSTMATRFIIKKLQSFNISFSQRPGDLFAHGRDESLHEPVPPDVVAYPTSTEQVSQIVKTCAQIKYPITPFGAGTSLEGGVAALQGGLSLDLSQLTKILSIDTRNFMARVEAGVSRPMLNTALKDTGLYFPIDPGAADASLGGMASTRASGTTAVKFGTMKERIAGLTVVLPNTDGTIIQTGGSYIKSSAGYDLTSLFVGSEGTLGVITEVLVKLVPIPEFVSVVVLTFSHLTGAVDTVIDLKSNGVDVTRAELLDALTMKAVKLSGLSNVEAEKPTLFLEFGGSKAMVDTNVELAKMIANEHGVISCQDASDPTRRAELWKSRHHAYYASLRLHGPDSRGWPTDVCVPLSSLSSVIMETAQDIERENILAPIFGHVGDGNFHAILVYNEKRDGQKGLEKLMAINSRLIRRALAVGGTATGEHGIGYGKRHWLEQQHGIGGLRVMKSIKKGIDPLGIMNIGKVFV
jgi:D-lactate dehydrogenase (cytochrome)